MNTVNTELITRLLDKRAAGNISQKYPDLKSLFLAPFYELMDLQNVGPYKAGLLTTAFELGTKLVEELNNEHH